MLWTGNPVRDAAVYFEEMIRIDDDEYDDGEEYDFWDEIPEEEFEPVSAGTLTGSGKIYQ